MKEVVLLFLGLMVSSLAKAEVVCVPFDTNICSTLGYNVMGSCPGGYVACPFNVSAKYCDNEAENYDFKFSLPIPASMTLNGWKDLTSDSIYAGSFVIGYPGKTGATCTSSLNSLSEYTVQSHTHTASAISNLGVYAGSKKNASAGKYSNWRGSTSKSYSEDTNSAYADDLHPINAAVDFYSYTQNDPTTSSSISSSLPSERPSCEELGYVHETSQCPGTYVKCPFNSQAVLCDLQAKAGEIKFSLQLGDHDGWLMLTNGQGGRSLSSIGTKYLKSELAKIIIEMIENDDYGWGTAESPALPDYKGVFLRIFDAYNTDPFTFKYNKIQPDSVGDHTHKMKYTIGSPSSADTIYHGNKYQPYLTTLPSSSSPTQSYSGVTSDAGAGDSDGLKYETRPNNYAANIFVYSGLLNVE